MATNKREKQTKKAKKRRKKITPKKIALFTFIGVAFAIFLAMLGYLFLILNGEKLLKENIEKMDVPEASIVMDRNEEEVYRLFSENRDLVKWQDMPEILLHAVVATEDQRFYEHSGIDPWSIGRAVVTDILHGRLVQGGSTITQQLAKNLFLTTEKTFLRKATEASMAVALENNYSKEEILEMYLNTIFFGHRAHGVKAAAKVYFGKDDLKELELWEAATLAAIPKGPSIYNPISYPERSHERRKVVLKLMYDQGYITEQEMLQAGEVEYVRPSAQGNNQANQAYIDFVLQEAMDRAELTEEQLMLGGYRIITALDQKAQRIMESTLSNAEWYPKDGPEQKVESGMVIMDHRNGEILAMFGGRDYVPRGTNRATEKHQPGSSFKPLISFAPALESGKWHPYSSLVDKQMDFSGYKPRNYNNKYQGSVTMAEAVKHSINVPAVWLLQQVGIDYALKFVKSLGIEMDPQDRNLSIALGGLTHGASPLEMAQAYTPFGNKGVWTEAYSITKIMDRNGRIVYEHKPQTLEIMSPLHASQMTQMLQAAVEGGTGKSAKMNRPVAGKTGTAQYDQVQGGNKDVWFVGYTGEWTAAVWMGFPRTDKNHYLTSGSGTPAAMFADVMSKALEGRPIIPFDVQEAEEPVEDEEPENNAPQGVDDLTAVYEEVMGCVILTWSEVEDGMTYKIYRKASNEDSYTNIASSATSLVNDFTVKQGETYTYYVTVVDKTTQLESEPSNQETIEISDLDPIIEWPSDEELPNIPDDQGNGEHGSGGSNGNGSGGIPQEEDQGAGTDPGFEGEIEQPEVLDDSLFH